MVSEKPRDIPRSSSCSVNDRNTGAGYFCDTHFLFDWSRESKNLPNSCVNGISTSFYPTHPYFGRSSGSSLHVQARHFRERMAIGDLMDCSWAHHRSGGDKALAFRLRLRIRSATGDPPWVTKNPSRRLPQVEIGGMNGGIKTRIHGSWNRGDLWSLSGLWECRRGKHACAFMAIYRWHGSWWLMNMYMYASLKGQWRRCSHSWNRLIGSHTVAATQCLVLQSSVDCQLKPSCAVLVSYLAFPNLYRWHWMPRRDYNRRGCFH